MTSALVPPLELGAIVPLLITLPLMVPPPLRLLEEPGAMMTLLPAFTVPPLSARELPLVITILVGTVRIELVGMFSIEFEAKLMLP